MRRSHKDLSSKDKIDLILHWFEDRPDLDFDLSFVYKLDQKLDDYGDLTESQETALDNIINSWKIKI